MATFNTVAPGTARYTASSTDDESRILWVTRTDNMAAHRFFGMGFALFEVLFVWSVGHCSLMMRAGFKCICGRVEYFQALVKDDAEIRRLNIFVELQRLGSLSRGHLLEDGYTAAQIDAMEARFESYMRRAGFEKFPPARDEFRASPAAWVHRGDRVPSVPGLDQNTTLQLLRSGRDVRLPERPEPLKFAQGDWPQVARSAGDPYVPQMPRTIRERADVDPAR